MFVVVTGSGNLSVFKRAARASHGCKAWLLLFECHICIIISVVTIGVRRLTLTHTANTVDIAFLSGFLNLGFLLSFIVIWALTCVTHA